MAKLNINNIENVEGKYHLMFYEGKKAVESAKYDLRYAWFSLLFFCTLVLLFVVISGVNLFYIGFVGVFLIFFLAVYIYLRLQKRKGVKQCIYAVQNSKTTDIIAKQVDNRGASKALIKSMSNSIDKYDAKKQHKGIFKKIKRKRKHSHLVGIISQFEEETKKKED